MVIRQETKEDYDKIYQFVKTAFETAKVSDGKEQDFVSRLRNSKNYIPELSFVMEQNDEITGYIMLSKTIVRNENGSFGTLLLAPLCIGEKRRNNGIGGRLLGYAVKKAEEMGYKSIFLAGDRNYYRRFGFVPASEYGIKCQYDLPENLLDNIMALEIIPGSLEGVSGIVEL